MIDDVSVMENDPANYTVLYMNMPGLQRRTQDNCQMPYNTLPMLINAEQTISRPQSPWYQCQNAICQTPTPSRKCLPNDHRPSMHIHHINFKRTGKSK